MKIDMERIISRQPDDQQYISYEIGGYVLGLPLMTGIIYLMILLAGIFAMYREAEKMQV